MSAHTKFTNCYIRVNNLILTGEQNQRRDYYELIFKDVLDVIRNTEEAVLDLTELEQRRREVFIINTPAKLRRNLRKVFGENVTERVIGRNSSGLCKLHGFS